MDSLDTASFDAMSLLRKSRSLAGMLSVDNLVIPSLRLVCGVHPRPPIPHPAPRIPTTAPMQRATLCLFVSGPNVGPIVCDGAVSGCPPPPPLLPTFVLV